MGSRIARWLGWEDDDVSSGGRKTKKKRKIQDDHGVRTHYAGKKVVRGGKSKRRRRDPDLPAVCADGYTGKVKVRGKTIEYIDGKKV